MTKNTIRNIIIGVIALIIIIIAVIVVSYTRIGHGDLELRNLSEDSEVYLDGRPAAFEINSEGNTVIENIEAGAHTVIVARPERWPWQKNVSIVKNRATVASPFNMEIIVARDVVPQTDPNYRTISALLATSSLPTTESPRISASGNASLAFEGDILRVTWLGPEDTRPWYYCTDQRCRESITIVMEGNVRSADFYKDADDLLSVAGDTVVGVIEVSLRQPLNFQTIYEGTSPRFITSADRSTLYVLDGTSTFSITP